MKVAALRTGEPIPAMTFVKLVKLHHMDKSSEAVTLLNSLNDNVLRSLIETCTTYSDEVRKVIAQSIHTEIDLANHHEDLERYINYLVEAAPALTPFFIDPKHRFYTEEQRDRQIGEWAHCAYLGFCETPHPHQREFIRGHALVFFVTGPSAPRREVYSDSDRLGWIGAHATELGSYYQTLEERKTWSKDFLEQLLSPNAVALTSGLL